MCWYIHAFHDIYKCGELILNGVIPFILHHLRFYPAFWLFFFNKLCMRGTKKTFKNFKNQHIHNISLCSQLKYMFKFYQGVNVYFITTDFIDQTITVCVDIQMKLRRSMPMNVSEL